MQNLKYGTNELIYETNRLVAKGEGIEAGPEWETGVSSWKLLYIPNG